jgi:hypothetical protein
MNSEPVTLTQVAQGILDGYFPTLAGVAFSGEQLRARHQPDTARALARTISELMVACREGQNMFETSKSTFETWIGHVANIAFEFRGIRQQRAHLRRAIEAERPRLPSPDLEELREGFE